MSEQSSERTVLPTHRGKRRYLFWTAYGLLVTVTVIVQSLPHGFPAIYGVRPLLAVPLVVCAALYEGPIGGAAVGVAAGFLWDLFSSRRVLGFYALLLLIVGCACGLLVRLLIRNNLLSALLLSAGALLVTGVADWFFNGVMALQHENVFALVHFTLPQAAYSFVLSPLVYGLVTWVARILRRRE